MYNAYLCPITEIYDVHMSTRNVTLGHVLEQVYSCYKYGNILEICSDISSNQIKLQIEHVFMS